MIIYKSAAEIDRMRESLSEGGEKVQCGWLKDRYGMSWQVVPSILPRMLTGPDPAGSARVLQSIMRMKKLDIEELKKAYGPKSA